MKTAHFSIYFYPTNSESFWLIAFKSFCSPNTVSNNFWTPSERVPFNHFLSMQTMDFYNLILLCFDFFHIGEKALSHRTFERLLSVKVFTVNYLYLHSKFWHDCTQNHFTFIIITIEKQLHMISLECQVL